MHTLATLYNHSPDNMILSRASDEPPRIIKAIAKSPDGDNNTTIYFDQLEYASGTIHMIMNNGIKNNNTITMFSEYGDISRMATPLHAIIYLLDKVMKNTHQRFAYSVETMICMIANVKENILKKEDAITRPLRVKQRDISRGERALAIKLKEFNEFPKKKQLRDAQQKYLADLMAQKDEFIKQRATLKQEREQLELEIAKDLSANDLIDALRDDFWDACIVAAEQEMIEFVTDPKSSSNTFTLYQEFQRLQDMFCSVFGYHSRNLKRSTYNYILSCIQDLNTHKKCEVLSPFGHTFIRMLTGKQPARTYMTPSAVELAKLPSGDMSKRTYFEMALVQLQAIHDLAKVFLTPLVEDGIEEQIIELVDILTPVIKKEVTQKNTGDKPVEIDLRTRLQALGGVGYDLRYVIKFLNRLKHIGYRNGTGGNSKNIKMIKTWIICQIMRRIQYFASSCVDHDHGQIELLIDKYYEFSGEKIPWTPLFKSMFVFREHVSLQIETATQICKMLDTHTAVKNAGLLENPTRESDRFIVGLFDKLGFGGLPAATGLTHLELQKRKMGRVLAAKKFEEYQSNYSYIWNLNNFSENLEGVFSVCPYDNPKEEYNKYLSHAAKTGTWSINHRDRLCKLKYQLKYNIEISNLASKFAPQPPTNKKDIPEKKTAIDENKDCKNNESPSIIPC